ncbi:MAG: 50S ribosomal protein L29 [Candidatus Nealsonbacteria bacterium]|nr:50S ribosomal protein L29 [Candidatus Nealsonbacteria bacterium]
MEITELKNKDVKELKKLLNEKKEHLSQMRFDLVSGKVKNVSDIRNTRKDIARISTMISTIKK